MTWPSWGEWLVYFIIAIVFWEVVVPGCKKLYWWLDWALYVRPVERRLRKRSTDTYDHGPSADARRAGGSEDQVAR